MVKSDTLKTAPKGYSADHEHIELLRMKSFAAVKYFSREEIFSSEFNKEIIDAYFALLPFRRYLNKAITV